MAEKIGEELKEKIIQIAVVVENEKSILYALSDQGNVYEFSEQFQCWHGFPMKLEHENDLIEDAKPWDVGSHPIKRDMRI